jgi:hypothetical protein
MPCNLTETGIFLPRNYLSTGLHYLNMIRHLPRVWFLGCRIVSDMRPRKKARQRRRPSQRPPGSGCRENKTAPVIHELLVQRENFGALRATCRCGWAAAHVGMPSYVFIAYSEHLVPQNPSALPAVPSNQIRWSTVWLAVG